MGIATTDDILAAKLFGPNVVKGAPSPRPVVPAAPLAVQQWLAFIASWWWLNILIEELPVRSEFTCGKSLVIASTKVTTCFSSEHWLREEGRP